MPLYAQAIAVTVAVIAIWLLQFLVCLGVGAVITCKLKSNGRNDPESIVLVFWAGMAVILIAVQLWHLIFPVDWRIAGIILAGGIFGLRRGLALIVEAWASATPGGRRWGLLVSGAVLCWISNLALAAPAAFDNGAYHIPTIKWISTFAIVRGLGNLDGLFAFNNSSLLYHALLERGFWAGRSSHIGNGVFLLVPFIHFALIAPRIRRRDSPVVVPAVLLTVLTFFAVDKGIYGVSNPTPDLVAAVIILTIGYFLPRFLKVESTDWPSARYGVLCLCLLAAIGPTVKLSAAAYCGVAWLMLLLVTIRQRSHALAVGIAAAGAVAGLTWVSRSIILSGYPFFPFVSVATSADWRMPVEIAAWYGWWVKTWARLPFSDQLADGYNWLPHWVMVQLRMEKITGLLPIILAGVGGVIGWLGRSKNRSISLSTAWIPVAAGLLVWAFTAPSIRLGTALLWLAAAYSLELAAATLTRSRRLSNIAVFIVFLLPFLAVANTARASRMPLADVIFVRPGPDHGLHPVHQTELSRRMNPYGLTYFVPKETEGCAGGQDSWDCLLWDGPLPAVTHYTSWLLEHMTLRNPAGMQDGFRLVEPPTGWTRYLATVVTDAAHNTGWGVRRLAHRYRISDVLVKRFVKDPGNIK